MEKKTILTYTTLVASFFLIAGIWVFNPVTATACGWGNQGGSDYVPQRQGGFSSGPARSSQAAIGSEQAKNIVSAHVSKLNPDLVVGNVNDSGGFFEIEVLNQSDEVIQLLGVDKYSGRLMLLN